MNDFLEQFVIESRELIESATADLLALEKTPGNRERLDSAFRAFHTLKGGAGIVDFDAMAKRMHGAEDALAGLRLGQLAIDKSTIEGCLACLDQVAAWLNAIEESGDIPPDAHLPEAAGPAGSPATGTLAGIAAGSDWGAEFLARHPRIRAKAKVIIRYVPGSNSFFSDSDPLARIAGLPKLLAVDLHPREPWPGIPAFDPFACNLIIVAAAGASEQEVASVLADVRTQCQIRAVAQSEYFDDSRPISANARTLLEAQLPLLDAGASPGRIGSAGRVASNVLRFLRRAAAAERIAQSVNVSLEAADARALREELTAVLQQAPSPISPQPAATPDLASASGRTLRIEAARIDSLVSLTGELVTATNALGYIVKRVEEGDPAATRALASSHVSLERLIEGLKSSVLGMRVLPLSQVFQRFPRVLRDLSTQRGKPLDLLVEGADTEADKVIVEMLFEPLLHVLRNAIDHGIEDPSERAATGKSATATITLRASRQGEHVVVEISDDGRGLNVDRIRQVALEKGLITQQAMDTMTEAEAIELIFEPGFSTAVDITDLSGRGVGMDAVRSAVGRIGGQVSVQTSSGDGTTVQFRLPFSVMMTSVMTVVGASQLFGVPIASIVRTLQVDADQIMPVGTGHAIVLKGRTIPVIALAELLGLPCEPTRSQTATLVLTQANGEDGALLVDRIAGRMDVMLKPLHGLLARTQGLAGSTVTGDGGVLLILDMDALFR